MAAGRFFILGGGLFALSLCGGCDSDGKAEIALDREPEVASANLDSSGCNSGFQQPITTSSTLKVACSPYSLADGQTLAVDGFDLTIEPGVEIRFGEGASLSVGWSRAGKLQAIGTAEKPIRFVASNKDERGHWRGVGLFRGAKGSVLDHVEISNAGQNGRPSVELEGEGVTLRNSRIRQGGGMHLRQGASGRLAELSGNDLSDPTEGEVALQLSVMSLGAMTGAKNAFPDDKVISVVGDVRSDLLIPAADVPYRVLESIDVRGEAGQAATLRIAAGARFQMADDTGLEVGFGGVGNLSVEGTPETPVVFTSLPTSGRPGAWKGIAFFRGAGAPTLRNLVVENAGAEGRAAVSFAGVAALGVFEGVTVRRAAAGGLKVRDAAARFERFSGNRFESIDGAAVALPAALAHGLGRGNVYGKGARIDLSGNVERDTTLTAQPGAYYAAARSLEVDGRSHAEAATLTLEPGVEIRFGPEAALIVSGRFGGGLRAIGTAAAPVRFLPLSGTWRGVRVEERGRVELRRAEVEGLDDRLPAAIRVHARASGHLRDLRFRKTPRAAIQSCGRNVQVDGLTLPTGATGVRREGC